MSRIVIAVLLSLLGPGLGQYYNRDFRKGTIILVLTTLLIVIPSVWIIRQAPNLLPNLYQEDLTPEMIQSAVTQAAKSQRFILNWISFAFLGLWAYAITQAYFKAKEINEKKEKK